MKFYRLTDYDYETDQAFSRHNPVRVIGNFSIPSLRCPNCIVFASCDRLLNLNLQNVDLQKYRVYQFLDLEEWFAKRPIWAQELGVEEKDIWPATKIGPPLGEVRNVIKEDVVHPFPGVIWVKENIVKLLKSISVTGVEFVPVELQLKKGLKNSIEIPQLWELYVRGKAWRKGVEPQSIIKCNLCGRTEFPHPDILAVDESRWDGSDFFNVDQNQNKIIVTEKVHDILVKNKVANIDLIPIDNSIILPVI